MFALAQLKRKPLKVSVKCEPELGEQLRGTYDEIEPGYHLNKRHWLTVTCGGAAGDELVRELIGGSYAPVASAGRGWAPPGASGARALPAPPFSRWLELIQLAERHG